MNQVKAGAALNYVIILLNVLLGLLYTPFMLRMLGQNEYGLYSLVASVIAYLTVLDFGFGNAIIRYTAKFRAEGKLREQWEMFGLFLIVYSVIGLFAFGAGLGLFFNVDALFDRTMTPEDISKAQTMMLFLVINLAVTFPLSIFGSIISAYERFVFQRVTSIISTVLSTITIIALLFMGYKAIALVVVHTIANISILLLNFLYCKFRLKIKIRFAKFDWKFVKEITVYSFWIFLNVIMDRVYWSTGQLILGAVSGTVAVAVFSVAILLEQMFMMFSGAISQVIMPRLVSMVATGKSNSEISDVFIKTGRIQCIILSLVFSGFIVFGRGFIDVWAGSNYGVSYIITLIFFGALFIPLIQNTGIAILQARNQLKFRSLLYLAISMVSLVLQVILGKSMGAVGCAIAIGGALLLGQGLVMNIYYYRKQAINIPQFWWQILRMLVVPVGMTVAGLTTALVVDYTRLPVLALGIVIFTVISAVLLWNFSMNDYERELLREPARKVLAKFHR